MGYRPFTFSQRDRYLRIISDSHGIVNAAAVAFSFVLGYNKTAMKQDDFRGVSPVPWVLVVLLILLLAGLVLLRLFAPGDDTPAPEPDPTPTVTPTPEPDEAELLLRDMTLREKIAQLLVVQPQALTGTKTVTAVDETLADALKAYPVGGLLLTAEHIRTADQLMSFTRDLQRANPGMLISVDEEGGRVARLMTTVGTTRLNNMFSYREEGTKTAYQNARTIARDLKDFGFNTDFAPVADVWTEKQNTVIGNRAYSDDYDEAAALVGSAVRGFRDGGVLCCLKHFPGHGSTTTDSHEEAAIVQKDRQTLLSEDLKPFVSGIEAGAEMVMAGHLLVPAVDDQVASMSKTLLTDLLREELGFEGVIITDGLQMAAAGAWSDGEKAVRCLSAGADLLLEISDVEGTVTALEQAVADGTLSEERIDESVLRVLRMKLDRGII